MDYILKGFLEAFRLIFVLTGMYSAQFLSLAGVADRYRPVCCYQSATGICHCYEEFAGKRLTITILNTLMAVPTVVVGLIVYTFISRQGPFGMLNLLFTPQQ